MNNYPDCARKAVQKMARLIDADAAKLTANDYAMFRCQLGGLVDVVEFLNDMPTVDAVPVVRCKDCKYFKTRLCENEDNYDDWFCADGERKGGDRNG